jgi:hypothetical protein
MAGMDHSRGYIDSLDIRSNRNRIQICQPSNSGDEGIGSEGREGRGGTGWGGGGAGGGGDGKRLDPDQYPCRMEMPLEMPGSDIGSLGAAGGRRLQGNLDPE